MKLNNADCIYTDQQIEDLRAETRALAHVGDPIPPSWSKVALVTNGVSHEVHKAALANEWVKHCVGINTVYLTSKRRVRNFIANVKTVTKWGPSEIGLSYGAFLKDKAWLFAKSHEHMTGVVICGASSILLEQIPQIKRAKDRGMLIAATNRACRAIPDLVDVVFYQESKPSTGQLLKDKPTIFEITAAPECIWQGGSPYFICTNDPAFDELFRDYLGRLCYPCGPSVTSLMVSYFLGQGFRQIVLAGCPMCNTTGNAVDYVPQSADVEMPRDWDVIVNGWAGERRRTTYQMKEEIDWIGKVKERSGVTLYDLSTRGAYKPECGALYNVDLIPSETASFELPSGLDIPSIRRFIMDELVKLLAIIDAPDPVRRVGLLNECNLLAAYNNAFLLQMQSEPSAKAMLDKLDTEIFKTAKELLELWKS